MLKLVWSGGEVAKLGRGLEVVCCREVAMMAGRLLFCDQKRKGRCE